jgi:hypothetical protein
MSVVLEAWSLVMVYAMSQLVVLYDTTMDKSIFWIADDDIHEFGC